LKVRTAFRHSVYNSNLTNPIDPTNHNPNPSPNSARVAMPSRNENAGSRFQ